MEGQEYANAIGVGYNGVSSVHFDYLDIYSGAKVWGSLTTDGSLTLLDNWNYYTRYKQLLIEPGS